MRVMIRWRRRTKEERATDWISLAWEARWKSRARNWKANRVGDGERIRIGATTATSTAAITATRTATITTTRTSFASSQPDAASDWRANGEAHESRPGRIRPRSFL